MTTSLGPTGQLPSNEVLTELVQLLTPQPFRNNMATFSNQVVIPTSVRETIQTLVAPSASALSSAGVLHLLNQVIETLEQIPSLIDEVCISRLELF